jgi:hypothetical protein
MGTVRGVHAWLGLLREGANAPLASAQMPMYSIATVDLHPLILEWDQESTRLDPSLSPEPGFLWKTNT